MLNESQDLSDSLEFSEEPGYRKVSGKEIMSYYTPKWLAIVGFIASIGASFQLPFFGFLLAKIVFALMDPIDDPDWDSNRDFWVIMFAIMCSTMFIFTYVQKLAFGYCSENLTHSFRVRLFESIMNKHIGWFDDANRAPGILGNMIQEDIS